MGRKYYPQGSEERGIDYSLRGRQQKGSNDDGKTSDNNKKAIEEMWGKDYIEREKERQNIIKMNGEQQQQQRQDGQNLNHLHLPIIPEFISFFDEVDEKMGWDTKRKSPLYKKYQTTSASTLRQPHQRRNDSNFNNNHIETDDHTCHDHDNMEKLKTSTEMNLNDNTKPKTI